MLKYILAGLLLEITIISIVLGIAAVAPSTSRVGYGTLRYEASIYTVNPGNETMLIVVYRSLNDIVSGYSRDAGYNYYIGIMGVRVSSFLKHVIKEDRFIVSSIPIKLPYYGQIILPWSNSSILLSMINTYKIAEHNAEEYFEVRVSDLAKHVNSGDIVVFRIIVFARNARAIDLIKVVYSHYPQSLLYSPLSHLVRQAPTNPDASSLLYRISTLYTGAYMSITYRLAPTPEMVVKTGIVAALILVFMYLDYRREPGEYKLLSSLMEKFRRMIRR